MAVTSTVPLASREDLSLAYTPGVALVCEAIAQRPELVHEYTWVGHTVAVVTDGSAVLGLGNIGPKAALPVMEGKAILFKGFGGINLEDISAPRCFEIEQRLIDELDIPVFHDDQHGTAVVALAALKNALRLTGRDGVGTRVVISGAGAPGGAGA